MCKIILDVLGSSLAQNLNDFYCGRLMLLKLVLLFMWRMEMKRFLKPSTSLMESFKVMYSFHQGRWCDGGMTVKSRKGSLADKTVQKQKRKAHENELDQVKIDEPLDNVYSFQYLGSRIQCDGDERADVEYRMAIAQTTFNSLSHTHMWKDH